MPKLIVACVLEPSDSGVCLTSSTETGTQTTDIDLTESNNVDVPIESVLLGIDTRAITCLVLTETKISVIPLCFRELDLHELNLSHNNIDVVPECIKLGFPNLYKLDLSYNFIRSFWFMPNSTRLRYLNIRHNYITELPYFLFCMCSDLEFLDLSENPFREHVPILNGTILPRLKTLRLENCNIINKYDHYFKNICNLQCLNLQNIDYSKSVANKIMSLSFKTYLSVNTITELNLSGLCFTEFTEHILELKSLQKLTMSHNFLMSLPENINRLTLLRHLNVSNNTIAYLPKTIGLIKDLQHLYASNNVIAALPKSLASSNVAVLDLYNNDLMKCSLATLDKMKLTAVDLYQNYIEPDDLAKYKEMRGELLKIRGTCYRHSGRKRVEDECESSDEGEEEEEGEYEHPCEDARDLQPVEFEENWEVEECDPEQNMCFDQPCYMQYSVNNDSNFVADLSCFDDADDCVN